MKNTDIFEYVIIGQYPPPPGVTRKQLEAPSPLPDYIICERPFTSSSLEKMIEIISKKSINVGGLNVYKSEFRAAFRRDYCRIYGRFGER